MKTKPSYEELARRVQELEKIEFEYKSSFREALRESENLFRLLYEKAPLGYQSLDENGHFIVVNQTWLDTLGYAKEEVIGKSFADFLHPDWRDHFRENFPRFKAIGEILGVEFEMVKKNGDLILVSFTGKISRSEKGDFQQTHCIFHDITEGKRTAKALLESEKRFRTLITSSSEVIYRMNPDWSEMLLLSGGYFLNDTIETNTNWLQEYIHPDDQSQVMAIINKAVMYKSIFEFEHRVFRADGTLGWVSSRAVPLLDSAGQIIEWFGAASDITARKKAEEALRASEENHRRLFETMAQGVIYQAADGTIISANPAAERILDLSFDQMRGKTSMDPRWCMIKEDGTELSGEDHPAMVALRTGETVGPVIRGVFHSVKNTYIWLSITAIPLFLPGDTKPFQSYATFEDVTERKRAEEALKKSEFRAKAMLQAIPDMMFRFNSLGVLLDYKAKESALYAQDIPTIIGTHTRDILPPEFVDLLDEKTRNALETGSLQTFEYQLPIPGQDVRTYECRMISSAADEVTAIVRDITERKRHEQEISAALNEKEVLLREVHHRVKNNLAAIISLIDLQRRNLKDTFGEDILTELSNRIRSMSLIHEKLYRAESLASIDFQDYTQTLISHLRTAFASPGITCRVDAPGITIPLDLATPCGLIINELMTNALKYAFPDGTPRPGNTECRILVRMRRDKDTYTLTVADNGIGWPPGFDWTKSQTLGMNLVRMLGQYQLGGQYVVDQDHGTSVTLTFIDKK